MSIFDGGQVLNLYVVNTMTKNIYDSNSYRVGHFILLPFKILKRFIRNNLR